MNLRPLLKISIRCLTESGLFISSSLIRFNTTHLYWYRALELLFTEFSLFLHRWLQLCL